MCSSSRTHTLTRIARKEEPLALLAPAPIYLAYRSNTIVENDRVMTALAWVMSLTVRRANSLARIFSEKHSLALVTPSPPPLLCGEGTQGAASSRCTLAHLVDLVTATGISRAQTLRLLLVGPLLG
jgi:hypothetical protein